MVCPIAPCSHSPPLPSPSRQDFYEWNARVQLTTWIPTPPGAAKKPSGPDDYASKHWSGLISGYYQARATGILDQALLDAAAGQPLNSTAIDAFEAGLAYSFQTAFPSTFPTSPVGDARVMSAVMRTKYARFYAPACGA